MTEGVFYWAQSGTEHKQSRDSGRIPEQKRHVEYSLPENGGRRWKTAVFPAFSTRKSGVPVLWKTQDFFFPIWRGTESSAEQTVKRKENPSTFFYIKGKVPTFLPRNWHESPGCITACISKTRFPCGKPGGKSGKPRGKLGLFFTKSVENPVEKVKSSLRNGKIPPFFVVKWAGVRLHFAVTACVFPHRCAHRAGVPVFS